MQSHVPERLRGELARVYRDWPDCMRPVPGMEELVQAVQRTGAHCFVLSNASVRFPELVARFSILRRIDDRFVSAFYEIYERFLSEYGLKAEECVFLDDLQENVDGAAACGIRAHRFTTVPDAAAFLSESLGVNLS